MKGYDGDLRGYEEGKAPKGYILVQDGWIRDFDDTGTDGIKVFRRYWLENKEAFADIDMFIAWLETKNVMVSAVEIYVDLDDVDKLKLLLLKIKSEQD